MSRQRLDKNMMENDSRHHAFDADHLWNKRRKCSDGRFRTKPSLIQKIRRWTVIPFSFWPDQQIPTMETFPKLFCSPYSANWIFFLSTNEFWTMNATIDPRTRSNPTADTKGNHYSRLGRPLFAFICWLEKQDPKLQVLPTTVRNT